MNLKKGDVLVNRKSGATVRVLKRPAGGTVSLENVDTGRKSQPKLDTVKKQYRLDALGTPTVEKKPKLTKTEEKKAEEKQAEESVSVYDYFAIEPDDLDNEKLPFSVTAAVAATAGVVGLVGGVLLDRIVTSC